MVCLLFTKEKLVDFITSSDIILLISAVRAETSSPISIFHKYFINSLTPGIWKEFGLLIPTLDYQARRLDTESKPFSPQGLQNQKLPLRTLIPPFSSSPYLAAPPPPSARAAVQSCPTLCNPMHCSPPGSPVHGIFQARITEWVAIPFPRGSSRPRNRTHFSCIAGGFFTAEPLGRPSIHLTPT